MTRLVYNLAFSWYACAGWDCPYISDLTKGLVSGERKYVFNEERTRFPVTMQ